MSFSGNNDIDVEGTKKKVQNELAAAALQDLFQKITEKCYVKCIVKPGAKLDNNDQTCLAKCMDRYLDTMTVVWVKGRRGSATAGPYVLTNRLNGNITTCNCVDTVSHAALQKFLLGGQSAQASVPAIS